MPNMFIYCILIIRFVLFHAAGHSSVQLGSAFRDKEKGKFDTVSGQQTYMTWAGIFGVTSPPNMIFGKGATNLSTQEKYEVKLSWIMKTQEFLKSDFKKIQIHDSETGLFCIKSNRLYNHALGKIYTSWPCIGQNDLQVAFASKPFFLMPQCVKSYIIVAYLSPIL